MWIGWMNRSTVEIAIIKNKKINVYEKKNLPSNSIWELKAIAKCKEMVNFFFAKNAITSIGNWNVKHKAMGDWKSHIIKVSKERYGYRE